MINPPPRKRFQIHLSTAIVMMFVAGALIWANTVEWTTIIKSDRDEPDYWRDYEVKYFGWPLPAISKEMAQFDIYFDEQKFLRIAADALVALFLLMTIWFLCERLIRRRAARKGASVMTNTKLEHTLVTKAKEFVRQHFPEGIPKLEYPCVIAFHARDGESIGIDGTSYGKKYQFDPATGESRVITYPNPYWGVNFHPPSPPGVFRFGGGMVVHIDEGTMEPTGAWYTQ